MIITFNKNSISLFIYLLITSNTFFISPHTFAANSGAEGQQPMVEEQWIQKIVISRQDMADQVTKSLRQDGSMTWDSELQSSWGQKFIGLLPMGLPIEATLLSSSQIFQRNNPLGGKEVFYSELTGLDIWKSERELEPVGETTLNGEEDTTEVLIATDNHNWSLEDLLKLDGEVDASEILISTNKSRDWSQAQGTISEIHSMSPDLQSYFWDYVESMLRKGRTISLLFPEESINQFLQFTFPSTDNGTKYISLMITENGIFKITRKGVALLHRVSGGIMLLKLFSLPENGNSHTEKVLVRLTMPDGENFEQIIEDFGTEWGYIQARISLLMSFPNITKQEINKDIQDLTTPTRHPKTTSVSRERLLANLSVIAPDLYRRVKEALENK